MMRYWIGTALLAGSWLLGLDYFYPANPIAWSVAVAIAALLLARGDSCRTASELAPGGHWWKIASIVLLLPMVWYAEWPYRAAPLLVALGLAVGLASPCRRSGGCITRWLGQLADGAIAAGTILFVQSLALAVYAVQTARSHELPWPLPQCWAGIVSLWGIDAVADGSGSIVFSSMRQQHRLAAAWEWFFDPATFLFFFGGAAMLAVRLSQCRDSLGNGDRPADPPADRWRRWIVGVRTLTIVVAVWLPVRVAILTSLYLNRVVQSDPGEPLHAMNHFFSPWILLLLLIAPVLLAWRFARIERIKPETECDASGAAPDTSETLSPAASRRFVPLTIALAALGVFLLTAAVGWAPSGTRKQGRVMVVERHSQWEPTTKPYDTHWFVEPMPYPEVNSGYNYARIYRYLEQYYEMSRLLESDKIDDAALEKCDVLVVKTPTERYEPKEAAAVARFVERGGGVLLIGDHTNFERSGTYLNDISRPMGFTFRDDLLFGFGPTPYDQLYTPPAVPHPIVQYIGPMDFAVSCSIDPGSSHGRAAIANTGLWSMGPEYHHENYHPIPQHCPEMRAGAFIQTWAARHGRGRAVAFGDSTIFSNFCAGQPGKSELMLGMVEWLNHAEPWLDPRPWLGVLGTVSLSLAGFFMARRTFAPVALQPSTSSWIAYLAVGACVWVVTSTAVAAANRSNLPSPKPLKPDRRVVIDRETSSVPLSKGAFPQGGEKGYGLFEQWIARLDCYTIRMTGDGLFSGDALVVVCPNQPVSEEYRQRVEAYVAGGGRLLVIDSPENAGSTANQILEPFGLTIRQDRAWQGTMTSGLKLPDVHVSRAREIDGGQPVARLGGYTVAAAVRHGQGSVLAIGFGSLWNDTRMGDTWMYEPDATTRARYEVLFGVVRPFLDGKPWPEIPKRGKGSESNSPLDNVEIGPKDTSPNGEKVHEKDSPLKESGPAEL